MRLRVLALLVGGFVLNSNVIAQENVVDRLEAGRNYTVPLELQWNGIGQSQTVEQAAFEFLQLEGAQTDPATNLPVFHKVIPVDGNPAEAEVSLTGLSWTTCSGDELQVLSKQSAQTVRVNYALKRSAGKAFLIVDVWPLEGSGRNWKKLVAFNLEINVVQGAPAAARDAHWKDKSVLAEGTWYKIATGNDGVYKVTYDFLRDCGFDTDGLASASIALYGIKSGVLSMNNADPRPDDLLELGIAMEDGGDGTFDPGDYFLFYGEDQINWTWNGERFQHVSNPFADSAYYFITTDAPSTTNKRIRVQSNSPTSNRTTTRVDYYALHEDDRSNLIQSGRRWYGEQLGLVPYYDIGFSVPNVVQSEQASVRTRFALRSVSISGSGMSISLPNQAGISDTVLVGAVSSAYAQQYARPKTRLLTFNPISADFLTKIAINHGNNPNAQAWIDFIEIGARRALQFLPPSMNFRDVQSVGEGNVTRFEFKGGTSTTRVWDISNVANVMEMKLNGSIAAGHWFSVQTDSLKEFVAFDEESIKTPQRIGPVAQQNLHGMASVDYLVITHPKFRAQAVEMAEMHSELDGFATAVVNVYDIYNEFSGGAQDLTAIREFVRMLHHRGKAGDSPLQYLLLFGDASYDYKDRIAGNSNFVPSHQTAESLIPTASVVSDDYYGLLDDDEGESPADLIDIAIGRLPARTKEEAQRMVDKIKHYNYSEKTFGDWRNRITLVADDPEGGRAEFQNQSSTIGDLADSLSPELNVRKVYLDAYKQESGSGGERYPEAREDISEHVDKGTLMMYYIGHGGELGWAHERVLEVPTINKWENLHNLPLFITATCEFTRYDDPRRTSAGEYVLLNPTGGGVALLTTTRAVYSGPNFDLTYSFTRQAFEAISENKPRLGEMCMQTKVENASTGTAGFNTRCFALMGDPAMRLAFPKERILISSIPDTIKALDKVKVRGVIVDRDSNVLEDFNGLVFPTLYDKEATIQGQNNDGQGVYFYKERRNILFRGKASVTNGEFEFEFVVPKDINKAYGEGKLSLYAHDGTRDASGAEFGFVIGGLSDNPVLDEEGPEVNLYMNNNQFVFGGMTNEDPDLYAEVWDENGINMVGTGIGHDITAVLDANGANTLVLNDYYEADVDSYQSGKIIYPFQDLEEGLHTLKLQVWDVNNNPSDAYTEFVVANDEELALDHVLNYPNPFTTNTAFYFEHNKPGFKLGVRIEIFTVSGKVVKVIDGEYVNDGFRVGPIQWDGLDEFGDQLARGVYVYRVSVKTPENEAVEAYEKLVLLK